LGVFPGVIFCLCALASGSWPGLGLGAGFVWPGHVPERGLDAKSMTGKTQKGTASGRAKKTERVPIFFIGTAGFFALGI